MAKLFVELNYMPEFDCMATRMNSICEKFCSEISQIGTVGVNFLSHELQAGTKYFCCPPVKMVGRVACHLLEKENIECLLVVPVWHNSLYWAALQESERFRESVQKEFRFRPKCYMSNGAVSLFSKCPKFEMAALVM